MQRQVVIWAPVFIYIGVGSEIFEFCKTFFYGHAGEALTTRLRGLMFRATLRQEIAYFDDRHHSTGVLTTRLARDAAEVKAVSIEKSNCKELKRGEFFSGLWDAHWYDRSNDCHSSCRCHHRFRLQLANDACHTCRHTVSRHRRKHLPVTRTRTPLRWRTPVKWSSKVSTTFKRLRS